MAALLLLRVGDYCRKVGGFRMIRIMMRLRMMLIVAACKTMTFGMTTGGTIIIIIMIMMFSLV